MGVGHATEVPLGDCLICFDEFNEENFVEYQYEPQGRWFPSLFCKDCLEVLQQTQFEKYCTDFRKSECAREQRDLYFRGPPVNVSDKNGFPATEGKEVQSFWSYKSKTEFSAKLVGSLEGAERERFWDSMKEFMIVGEKEEDDA